MKIQMTQAALAAAIAASLPAAAFAGASLIDFEGQSNGDIINNQYPGVTISADNINNNVDLAVIFDARIASSVDGDLNGPSWSAGNLAPGTELGNLLILQENGPDQGTNVILPDDEGRRPAGNITFEFDEDMTYFGLDIVDIEGPVEFATNSGFFLQFFSNGVEVADVALGELVTPGNTFYDPSIEYGDNSANRISPFTVADLNAHFNISNVTSFDTVVVNLGGSGAIDNVVFGNDAAAVPTPSAAAAGLALIGMTLRRRRKA